MPTINEVLKMTGMSDEDIAKIDAKALSAFSGVLTTAEQKEKAAAEAAAKAEQERQAASASMTKAEQERQAALKEREAAELAQRSNAEFYETKIMPALTSWDEQKAAIENARIKAESEAAFYRTQLEGAKTGGFVPVDAPKFEYTPPANNGGTRDGQGRFVAGAPGGTPGSPTFMDPEEMGRKLSDTAGLLTDIQWKYQSLYGSPMPIPPSQLIQEADAQKLPPMAYAERRFKFAERDQELKEKQRVEYESKLKAEAAAPFEQKLAEEKANFEKLLAQKEREWAEKGGSNPDVRRAIPPQNTEIARAVKSGERKDPLLMNENERHAETRRQIHDRITAEAAIA